MFSKVKSKIAAALFAAVAVAVAAVAALIFSPETEKAYAAVDPTLYWGLNANDNELIISADSADTDGQAHSGSFTSFLNEYDVPWRDYSEVHYGHGYINKATVKAGVKPLSTAYWFNDCSELRQVDLSGLDTSEVTKMTYMFGDCTKLQTLDISNFKTSKVTAMSYMFDNCSDLQTIVFPATFVTDNVTSMEGMFSGCESLTSLDLSSFNTANVLFMNDMFNHCNELTSLDISSFDTAKVTRMLAMFCYCPKLTEINFPDTFVTSEVTDMTNMFWMCTGLTSLDLSGFNTEKVMYMDSIFYGCEALTSLNLSGFDNRNVTRMNNMFYGCTALTSLDLSGFNTQNVSEMDSMFLNCSALTSLDLSSFNTENVTNMNNIFWNCDKLTELDLSSFNTSSVTKADGMFYGCDRLTTIKTPATVGSVALPLPAKFWTNPQNTEGEDIEEITAENTNKTIQRHEKHNYTGLELKCSVCDAAQQVYYGLSADGTTLIFSGDESDTENLSQKSSFDSARIVPEGEYSPFKDFAHTVTAVEIKNRARITDMLNFLTGFTKLERVDLSGADSDMLISMTKMFAGCASLKSVDLSCLDGLNILNSTAYMFSGCENLETVTFPDYIRYANLSNMAGMFRGCKSLKSVDLSNFDTTELWGENAYGIFEGCSSLNKIVTPATVGSIALPLPAKFEDSEGNLYSSITTSLQGGKTLTRHVHNFVDGVCSCGEKVQIYWWITDNKLTVSTRECELAGVTDADKGSFDFDAEVATWNSRRANIEQVKIEDGVAPASLAGWFAWFENLVSIDLSGLDTSNVTSTEQMFEGCSALTSLDLSGFNTEKVTNMSMMFFECTALTSLDLSSFDTANVTDMNMMFEECAELTELDLSSFDMSNVTQESSYGMIYKCNKLQVIKAPKAMGRHVTISMPLHEGNMTMFKFWNETADVDMLTFADAGKTLKRHDGHTYEWVTVTEATCTQAGSKQETCSVCGEKRGEAVAVDALGHDWETEFTVDKAATCTEKGSKSKHCSRCGEKSEVTEIAAHGHDLTHHAAVGATEDGKGNIEYWECGECEKFFRDGGATDEITDKASVEIPKLTPETPSADGGQDKKSYVWICWLLIPLAFAAGGVTLGVWLYKKKNN